MMILEEGTDEQMLECAFQACLRGGRARWRAVTAEYRRIDFLLLTCSQTP